jgi:hypothetical protein
MAGIALTGVAASITQAQGFDTDGRSGVYVQGNGRGMAGTFDENGFRGIAVGPDGKVKQIRSSGANPLFSSATGGIRIGNGAFAGAMSGGTAIGPGGFDPFAFVFGQGAPMVDGVVAEGVGPLRDLTAARRAFRQGRYDDALRMLDQAVSNGTSDAEVEQLRALTLFAVRKYDPAAAAAYRVLESEAAWDWPTLRQMYVHRDTYVQQLRALQAAASQPAASAGVHFLLAYHCLMLDQVDAARAELLKTRELQPESRLVDHLLATLPPSIVGP